MNDKSEGKKDVELALIRDLLKKQNGMLGQFLIFSNHLLYLQKSISLLDLEEIKRVLVEKLPHILSIRYFTLFLFDKKNNKLDLACHNRPDLPKSMSIAVEDSPVMRDALTHGKYIVEANYQNSKFFQGKRNSLFQNNFLVCAPLMVENEIVGILNLNDNIKGFFSVGELDFVINITEFLSLTISNALLFEKAEDLSVTDGLTGIKNRQYLENVFVSEFSRSLRYKSPLSAVIIDVDHFKSVNDTYGHQKGDQVLIEIGKVLNVFCRAHDTIARYGGEEFVIVLPETNIKGAFPIAERIRNQVGILSFSSGAEHWNVTISCGVAEIDFKKMKSKDDLLKAADQALYKAKENGRNQTIIG
jgi:diguanylate cyclase (GGDEF)-like protein